MLELIADYARIKYGPSSYELTEPSTPAAARYAAVQRFNGASAAAGEEGGKPFLYLITPRSIGLGTQLPGLSAAIVFESDWHPRLDIQALHRWVEWLGWMWVLHAMLIRAALGVGFTEPHQQLGRSVWKPFLYLITPRSIGLGTQLQGLSAAIVFDSDWHPRLDIQALHRWVGLHGCMCKSTLCTRVFCTVFVTAKIFLWFLSGVLLGPP
jgi:hypothetical protein